MENTLHIIIVVIVLLLVSIVILSLIIMHLRKKNSEIVLQAKQAVSAARSEARSEIAYTRNSCVNEINSLKAKCEEEIDSIKQDCILQIQHAKEDIESDKASLFNMDEKELLVNIMVALNGYGGRFDRIERHLTDDQITKRITCLFQDTITRLNGITTALTEQIEEMKDSIESSLNDSDVLQKMDNISSTLSYLNSDINDIKSSVYNGFSLDIASDIDDVKKEISSLQSTIEEIKSAIDYAKYAAENAQYAAESVKDSIDSHF